MLDINLVKELDKYAENKLATLIKVVIIMGKERQEYLFENPKNKGNRSCKRRLNTGVAKLEFEDSKKRRIQFKSFISEISEI